MPSTAFANPLDRFRDWSKTQKLIAMADHTVTGSNYLAAFAAQHARPGKPISVLPTVVDGNIFRPAPERRDPRHFTIGWIGTPRGTAYLRPLRDSMAALVRERPDARFLFIGAEAFDCGDIPVEFRPWSLNHEVPALQSFDAGIMPLFDDEEARGKCGFKIIEYMNAGVPVVCSPVGANLEIVEEGRTGLFASSSEEWTRALLSLATNDGLRDKLVKEGRKRAEEDYCLEIMAPRLLDVLHQTRASR